MRHGKAKRKGLSRAPDWTIEIVSPSSAKMDYERKTALYREAGVREY
ncbi:MAG: Uma2 family endonuclease [Lachnospiraceae bacterium]|nr:Uma2 family endonuclease [Lachnospiraceae bacterium]